jgi:hypothetical protein
MEKLGKSLSPNFLTFKYPGREPKSVHLFLKSRPDIKDLFVYDLCLSTGALLYSCAGGIGVTKEKYIIDMHSSIGTRTFSSSIQEHLHENFKGKFNKNIYLRIKERFNKQTINSKGTIKNIELYLLWICSNFAHKYRTAGGYDGNYLPCQIDFLSLQNASTLSRKKGLLFRKEDLFSFSESIINDNVVLYIHIPDSFGLYGANFFWNKNKLKEIMQIVNELDQLGYKICVSARHFKRGQLFFDYRKMFPGLCNVYIEQFKVSKLGSDVIDSDMYLLNF